MKIIIVGCGKVGYAIAGQMAVEKHDVVMVDGSARNYNVGDLERLSNTVVKEPVYFGTIPYYGRLWK